MARHRKLFQLPIRTVIVAGLVLCGLLAALVVISLQHHLNRQHAADLIISRFQQTVSSTQEYLQSIDTRAISELTELAKLPRLQESSQIDEENIQLLSALMQRNQLFQAVYLAQPNGDVEQLVNLQASPIIRQQLHAEEADYWLRIQLFGEAGQQQRRLEYYDRNFRLRHAWLHDIDLDITSQSWFADASTDKVIKRQSYLLPDTQASNQTYSIRLPESGSVLAITAELFSLNTFLQSRDTATEAAIYFYPQQGEVIASNQPQQLPAKLPEAPRLALDNNQLALIESQPVLRIASETVWPPFSFTNSGVPTGYAVDVLHYISRMTGLEMHYVTGANWQELASKFVDGQLDIMQPVFYSEFRNFMGEITSAFVEAPYGIISKSNEPLTAISQLNGKTVAIPEGWSLTGRIRAAFPEINIIEVDTTHGVFAAVINGEADAGMDTAITLQYLIEHRYPEQVTLHQSVDFSPAQLPGNLHFMINRQRSGIADIFNQALEELSGSHQQALVNKWFNFVDNASREPALDLKQVREAGLPPEASLQSLTLGDTEYFVYHQQLGLDEGDQPFLTFITPQSAVMATVWQKTQHAISVAVWILLLLLPVSWFFASWIASAIQRLQHNLGHVRQRRFAEVEPQPSHITEWQAINTELQAMSESIQQYDKTHADWVDAFIAAVAKAIDAKSNYPTKHHVLVPELTMLLADAASESAAEAFQQFRLEDDVARRELRLAAWLHGLGKITTPEHLVDKRSKLEMVYNRVHEIRMRFEVLWRDAELEYWQQSSQQPEKRAIFEQALEVKKLQLQDDFAFVAQCNLGSEFMDKNANARLKKLAAITWERHFDAQLGLSATELAHYKDPRTLPVMEQLLADKPEHIVARHHLATASGETDIQLTPPEYNFNYGELHNLMIESGTLTREERFRINEHILTTIALLEKLPYPVELSNIPRYATTYLETMNGTGYPRGLAAADLSVAERIIMLANVFEALTAAERPYKKAKTLSVAILLLHQLVEEDLMDRDIFELFLTSGVYLQYAKRFMTAEQIDEVDISKFIREEERYI